MLDGERPRLRRRPAEGRGGARRLLAGECADGRLGSSTPGPIPFERDQSGRRQECSQRGGCFHSQHMHALWGLWGRVYFVLYCIVLYLLCCIVLRGWVECPGRQQYSGCRRLRSPGVIPGSGDWDAGRVPGGRVSSQPAPAPAAARAPLHAGRAMRRCARVLGRTVQRGQLVQGGRSWLKSPSLSLPWRESLKREAGKLPAGLGISRPVQGACRRRR